MYKFAYVSAFYIRVNIVLLFTLINAFISLFFV